MLPRFVRLLGALLLACSGVVLVQAPGQAACGCQDGNLRTQARRADVVFSGVLLDRSSSGRQTTYTLRVERVYRGTVPDTRLDVVTASARNRCGLDLRVDKEYVVFARESATELGSNSCSGTGRATAAYVERVEKVLGPGHPATETPSEPAPPDFTRVDDSRPPDFTRAAAPGAALVLVGLLGLLLFRRRG